MATQGPKRPNLRNRMTSAVRRSSSFLIPTSRASSATRKATSSDAEPTPIPTPRTTSSVESVNTQSIDALTPTPPLSVSPPSSTFVTPTPATAPSVPQAVVQPAPVVQPKPDTNELVQDIVPRPLEERPPVLVSEPESIVPLGSLPTSLEEPSIRQDSAPDDAQVKQAPQPENTEPAAISDPTPAPVVEPVSEPQVQPTTAVASDVIPDPSSTIQEENPIIIPRSESPKPVSKSNPPSREASLDTNLDNIQRAYKPLSPVQEEEASPIREQVQRPVSIASVIPPPPEPTQGSVQASREITPNPSLAPALETPMFSAGTDWEKGSDGTTPRAQKNIEFFPSTAPPTVAISGMSAPEVRELGSSQNPWNTIPGSDQTTPRGPPRAVPLASMPEPAPAPPPVPAQDPTPKPVEPVNMPYDVVPNNPNGQPPQSVVDPQPSREQWVSGPAIPVNAPFSSSERKPIVIAPSDDGKSVKSVASGFPFNADSEDPFRDPDPPVVLPDILGPSEVPGPAAAPVPFPAPHSTVLADRQVAVPVSYPLPEFHEVIPSNRVVRHIPSDYTLTARSERPASFQGGPETDETRPLLPRNTGKQADHNGHAKWPVSHGFVHAQGWTEHILPDSSKYYTHDVLRITTDVDLQDHKKLKAVSDFLELPEHASIQPRADRWELWLREMGATKDDIILSRYWVNHGAKTVSLTPPPTTDEEFALPSMSGHDDRLDQEYRYWSFMESHPAHVPLPLNAHAEAMDALTWAYTDRLLRKTSHSPPPFDQDECQQLMAILRSLENSDSNLKQVVHTRTVSRILLRVAHWRQKQFRPEKPLPRDASRPRRHIRPQTPNSSIGEFVMSCLCLGIPYFFADRHGQQRLDAESGLRTTGPLLVIGASICLVAAVILSASVTFIALPSLGNVARTAGFVAILGTVASLGSSIIALFRHQSELEYTRLGGEHIVLSTGGSILLSLPAVFLAWSIVAFVTGLMFYLFQGNVPSGNPSPWTEKFAQYTRWTAVGVLGFSAGVLITSSFFARR